MTVGVAISAALVSSLGLPVSMRCGGRGAPCFPISWTCNVCWLSTTSRRWWWNLTCKSIPLARSSRCDCSIALVTVCTAPTSPGWGCDASPPTAPFTASAGRAPALPAQASFPSPSGPHGFFKPSPLAHAPLAADAMPLDPAIPSEAPAAPAAPAAAAAAGSGPPLPLLSSSLPSPMAPGGPLPPPRLESSLSLQPQLEAHPFSSGSAWGGSGPHPAKGTLTSPAAADAAALIVAAAEPPPRPLPPSRSVRYP